MENHKICTYKLPEEKNIAMVGELPAIAQQYVADLRYGIEALSKASPEELHNIVVYISGYFNPSQEKPSLSEEFNKLFDKWWEETCIYSGPNLCYNNRHFISIKRMGKVVLPLIEEKAASEPQYKQRHIQWLKKGMEL